jgi:GTP cyclohydrolase I
MASFLERYDVGDEAMENTPRRFVKALEEMTKGYEESPATILGKVFEDSYDEVVILRNIPYTSVCLHHILPFSGTADVGYLPGKVVGLSKLARLVDCFARRLQMQERMTRQIAESLMEHLEAKGAAVVTRGVHSCMQCRGVKKSGAEMVCSTMLGVFRDDVAARAEFLTLCKG